MSAEVRKLAEKEIMDRQLIKRYGQPEEVAALIVYLASEQAGFVTGQTFAIDGGLKMP
jgi:3-oxoacyl-[acyl-carrier protein] reductase